VESALKNCLMRSQRGGKFWGNKNPKKKIGSENFRYCIAFIWISLKFFSLGFISLASCAEASADACKLWHLRKI